jgi:hypothetical protein
MATTTPYRIETCQGAPIALPDRTLAPVVKVLSRAEHRGTVSEHAVSGQGWVFVSARPTHVIETRNGKLRTLPIRDPTSAALLQMALVSVLIPIVALALIALARWTGKREPRQ